MWQKDKVAFVVLLLICFLYIALIGSDKFTIRSYQSVDQEMKLVSLLSRKVLVYGIIPTLISCSTSTPSLPMIPAQLGYISAIFVTSHLNSVYVVNAFRSFNSIRIEVDRFLIGNMLLLLIIQFIMETRCIIVFFLS